MSSKPLEFLKKKNGSEKKKEERGEKKRDKPYLILFMFPMSPAGTTKRKAETRSSSIKKPTRNKLAVSCVNGSTVCVRACARVRVSEAGSKVRQSNLFFFLLWLRGQFKLAPRGNEESTTQNSIIPRRLSLIHI